MDFKDKQEFLDDLAGESGSTIKKDKPFEVDSEVKANWAFNRLREIREEREKHQAKYKAHKDELEEWNKSKTDALDKSEEYFTELLKVYYHEEKEKDPDYELDTPAGRLSTTMRKKWDYEDEKLVEYLESHDFEDLVKVTKRAKKADIKKAFTPLEDGFVYDSNGEKVEGIRIKDELGYNLTLRESKWKAGKF